jgi:ADP-L-glycero-D-manno-heptose 6-epimerase|tara:strand:- start:2196 stop:2999 length:804 start_codon:yes stop_codon:yes gene_type:complete
MIILTGSSGFIGKHFAERLNDDVVLIDQDDAWRLFKDFEDWDKVDLVLHQGAISSTTERDLQKLYHYNVAFSCALLNKAIEYQFPIKYASSASVYGNQSIYQKTKSYNPLNQYAISKLQVDYTVIDNMDKFSLVQGFRYFNVYGSGEEDKGNQASPVSKFTKEVKETGELNLFSGSNKFLRDFVCVDDVVDIVLHNNMGSGIYDLGTGSPVSFQHVAELVAKKENGKINTIPFPDHLKGKYQSYTCADMSWIGDYKFKTVEEYLQVN